MNHPDWVLGSRLSFRLIEAEATSGASASAFTKMPPRVAGAGRLFS